jgi:hypothetical protein
MLDGVVLTVSLFIGFLLGTVWLLVRPFAKTLNYEESYLKLEVRSLCAPLFALIFTISGLFVVGLTFTFPPLSTLTCTRGLDSGVAGTINCEVREFDVFGHEVNVVSIQNLKAATLEEYDPEEERLDSKQEYFIALFDESRMVDFGALHEIHDDGITRISGIVDRINGFIEDPSAETLSVANDVWGDFDQVTIIGLFLVLVAFLIYSLRERAFLEIDKQAENLTVKGYRLLKAWQTTEVKCDLANVKNFDTKIVNDTGPDIRGTAVGLVIRLNSGEIINVKNTFDSRGGKDKYATFLNQFLKQQDNSTPEASVA